MGMKEINIMRGLPGCGKTTWLEKINSGFELSGKMVIVSADNYRMINGLYTFDKELNKIAHDSCLREYLSLVKSGCERIAVDNTNSEVWEIAPYYRLGEIFDYSVKIVRLHCSPEIAIQRGLHNVPAATLMRMYASIMYTRLPTWWKEEIFFV